MQASWNCGAVAPRRASGPGSPSPLVFPAGGRERRRPGPGQHSGRWPQGEVSAAPALPGAGAQSPCFCPQVCLCLALLGLSFLGDRGESPGKRPAALEPRPRPSGQAVAPWGWVFPSREAGLRPHVSCSLRVCPGPSHHLAFLPGSIPGRYVWGHFQAHQFFFFQFYLFLTPRSILYWDVAT